MIKKLIVLMGTLGIITSLIAFSGVKFSAESNENSNLEEQVFYMTDFTGSYSLHGVQTSITFTFDEMCYGEGIDVSHYGEGYSTTIGEPTINGSNPFVFFFTMVETGIKELQIDFYFEQYIATFTLLIKATSTVDYFSVTEDLGIRQQEFMYLYDNDLITEEEYNTFVYDDPAREDFEETEDDVPDGWWWYNGEIYVSGYITWLDENGDDHPARYMEIQIWDDNVLLDEHLYTTYTNSSGYYSATIINNNSIFENGWDLKLKVLCRNQDMEIFDFLFVQSYTHDEIRKNCVNGREYDLSCEIDTNSGKRRDEAVSVFQALTYGLEFMNEVLDAPTPYLCVQYPGWIPNYYNFVFDTISISGGDHDRWYTILHEFGHYAADFSKITDYWPATHGLSDSNFDDRTKWVGGMLAWSEGFAHYFCVATIENTSLKNDSINDVNRYYYRSRNIESNSEYLYGEGNEWVIARLLWDLTDGKNETHDSVELGHKGLWDKLANKWRVLPFHDFSEFWSTLNIGPEDEDYGKLLTYYNIAPNPESPVNNNTPGYAPPLFEWFKGGSHPTSNSYRNNSFTLYIKDQNNNVVWSKDVGNTSSYQMTEAEYTTLLQSSASYFKWNVRGSNNSYPSTGPYYSKTLILNRPTAQAMSTFADYSFTIATGEYKWYKFTAPVNGTFIFYSHTRDSSFDPYLSIFNTQVAGKSISNRVDYNDDGGGNRHFKWTTDMSVGDSLYFRVQGYNWTSVGSACFRVEVEHTHSYTHYGTQTSHYKTCSMCGDRIDCSNEATASSINITNHRWSCSCGFTKTEAHRKYTSGTYQYCYDCDWSQSTSHSHSYTHHYVSAGNYMGMARHYAYCACGVNKLMACLGFAVDPGQTPVCAMCGQEMGRGGIGMLYSITLPDGQEILSSIELSSYDAQLLLEEQHLFCCEGHEMEFNMDSAEGQTLIFVSFRDEEYYFIEKSKDHEF